MATQTTGFWISRSCAELSRAGDTLLGFYADDKFHRQPQHHAQLPDVLVGARRRSPSTCATSAAGEMDPPRRERGQKSVRTA